jgi:hypothetical protein
MGSMNIDIGRIIDLIKDPDLKLKINDLYGENLILKEENFKLKQQIEKQKDLDDVRAKLIHEDNHYFLKNGNEKDGPYCTNCWDSDSKLIRLHKGNLYQGVQYYTCPNCKTQTTTGSHIPKSKTIDAHWY